MSKVQFFKLNHGLRLMLLSVLTGITEGFGLALFVPLIDLINGEQSFFEPMPMAMNFFDSFESRHVLIVLSVIILILLIGSFFVSYIQRLCLAKSKFDFQLKTRANIMEALFDCDWPQYKRTTQSEVLNMLTVQVDRASACLTYNALMFSSLILTLAYISVSIYLSWKLTVLTIVSLAVLAAIVSILLGKITTLGERTSAKYLELSQYTSDVVRNIKILRVIGAKENFLTGLESEALAVRDANFAEDQSHAKMSFLMRSGPVLFVAVMILLSQTVLQIPTTLMLVTLIVTARLVPSVLAVRSNYHSYLVTLGSLNVLEKFHQNLILDRPPKTKIKRSGSWFKSKIIFKDISYKFDGEKTPSIKNVSFEIPKNKTVAFVGVSGSGKSTILDLITGIILPSSGSIFLDQEEIGSLGHLSGTRKIGYVGQDLPLFNGSLRHNLTLGLKLDSESEISAVLKKVGLRELVQGLESGLDTLIQDGGNNLSGGERQRICIARALLMKPEILVLDEVTSSLDTVTEMKIIENLKALSGDCTIVMVTHRLACARHADIIYVVDGGKITEKGDFLSLTENEGTFRGLLKADG